MMINTGLKFLSMTLPPLPMTLRSRSLTWSFHVKVHAFKVYKISLHPNLMLDLVNIWYDDRYWSGILSALSPPLLLTLRSRSQTYDFHSKVFALKVYKISLLPNRMMDLVLIGMMIDVSVKFLTAASPPLLDTLR